MTAFATMISLDPEPNPFQSLRNSLAMDNNNSNIDFEILDVPTPGWILEEEQKLY